MAEPLLSSSWYRIARLQPRLKSHTRIHRHVYGSEVWYVIQDHTSGQLFRFTPEVHHIITLMDGVATVQQLWQRGIERFGDGAPTQGEMVRILSQLHAADMLLAHISPDTQEIFSRSERARVGKMRGYLLSPLSWKFPLFDPERFLAYLARPIQWLFNRYVFILWLVVVCSALLLVGQHWSELSKDALDRIFSAKNLFLLWLVYPVVKILHEFGHAAAVKRWGGEVHEVGIMLLGFMPVPYVDASAASAFPEKRRRMLVSAAGMMVELLLAAVALFFWLAVEPGVIRSILYNVMLVGGISTVAFNGNPLLRYDGYYFFCDLVEEPNLAQRSSQYLAYLAQRHLFAVKHLPVPPILPRKRPLFALYAVASFVYRFIIFSSMALFIAGRFFVVGIILAIWLFIGMIVMPLIKGGRFLLFSPVLQDLRGRALLVTFLLTGALLLVVFVIPFPSWTRAEGVIWVPEEGHVRAATNGFVTRVTALPNAVVRKGELLIECADQELVAERAGYRAELSSLEARYDAEVTSDRVKARVTAEEMAPVRANLARAEERLRELSIASQAEGRFVIPRVADLPGRFVRQGELLAYVVQGDHPVVRVVVSQADVDQILRRNEGIQVRLAERLQETIPARLARVIPGGADRLPSTVLGSVGGGKVVVDPRDQEGRKTLQKTFQVDIDLPITYNDITVGGRVYVRFDHGHEPLAIQWYRSLRRLFLSRLHV